MIIYKATNKINGKVYIGQTNNSLSNRKSEHKSNSYSGRKKCYFNLAIIKHGFEHFEWEEIDMADSFEELDYLEKYWIKFYRSNNRIYGYNLSEGGNVNRGFKKTEKQIERMSEIGKKLWESGEKRKMMSDKVISWNRKGENHPMYGKKHSQESKEKMSKAKIGKSSHNKGKKMSEDIKLKIAKSNGMPVLCIELNKVFYSATEAGKYFNVHKSNICKAAKGKIKTCCNYHWKYLEDKND